MKITYCGFSPVDIDGHDGVEPGQTVDVLDAVGASLLTAGSAVADDGTVTPADPPVWVPAKSPKSSEPADAGKES